VTWPAPLPYPPVTIRRRPSTAGYWVAGVLAVLTPLAALVLLVVSLTIVDDSIDGFARTAVPGSVVLTADAAQHLLVYGEGPAVASAAGDASPVAAFGDVTVTVTGPDGRVPLRAYPGELTYGMPDRAGTALASFTTTSAGSYTVQVTGTAAPGSAVAVGRDVSRGFLLAVVGPLVTGFLGLLSGCVVWAVTYSRRSATPRWVPAPRPAYPYPYAGGPVRR
jgi:hypothetical protein